MNKKVNLKLILYMNYLAKNPDVIVSFVLAPIFAYYMFIASLARMVGDSQRERKATRGSQCVFAILFVTVAAIGYFKKHQQGNRSVIDSPKAVSRPDANWFDIVGVLVGLLLLFGITYYVLPALSKRMGATADDIDKMRKSTLVIFIVFISLIIFVQILAPLRQQ